MEQLHASAGAKITLPAMARRAGLGERTFLRRFFKATGLRPTEYLQHVFVRVMGLSPAEYRRRFAMTR